jgi:hypothetical protein
VKQGNNTGRNIEKKNRLYDCFLKIYLVIVLLPIYSIDTRPKY